MIERIISRGVLGPELAALQVARVCGVPTGGYTACDANEQMPESVGRYGLSAQSSFFWNALWRNVRQADGTLTIGPVDPTIIRHAAGQGRPVFEAAVIFEKTAEWIARWVRRFDIRTLNVVGAVEPAWDDHAHELMLAMLDELGCSGRRLRPKGTEIVAAGGALHALSLWPRQRAWRWNECREQWGAFRNWQSLAVLSIAEPHPSGRFRRLLPEDVRQWATVGWSVQLDLVECLSRLGRPAQDLARAGRWPVLRLLANARMLLPRRSARWTALHRLVRRCQREIIGEFGFPATESAVRLLAKVPCASSHLGLVLALRELLNDPAATEALRHLPAVNSSVVEVLACPRLKEMSTGQFLREVARDRDDELHFFSPLNLRHELQLLTSEIDRTGRQDQISAISSISQFRTLLAELEGLPNACCAALSGIPGLIEPLVTGEQLEREGREMQHCVASYSDEMVRGRVLLFRVLAAPDLGVQRATLQLRGFRDQWQIQQLAGPLNAAISTNTRRLVETWRELAHVQPPLSPERLELSCREKLANSPGSRHAA